jgi:hypothetical protein
VHLLQARNATHHLRTHRRTAASQHKQNTCHSCVCVCACVCARVRTTYVELNVLGQGDGDAVRVNDVRIEPCIRGVVIVFVPFVMAFSVVSHVGGSVAGVYLRARERPDDGLCRQTARP